MRTLVTGRTGTLGRACLRLAVAAGHEAISASRTPTVGRDGPEWRRLDIRDEQSVRQVIDEVRPDVILHTAYQQSDWTTTADGSANVARAAAHFGARMVAVSSDAVFPGRPEPYPETAPPDPVTAYGAAKVAAETAIADILPGAAVVRTSLIIGSDGRSPMERRVKELVTNPERGVFFTDEVRCPVDAGDLAAFLLEIAASGRPGIHHAAGPDAVSRYELAVLLARRDGLNHRRLRTGLRRDSGLEGALEVRLDCAQTEAALGTRLRGAYEFLSVPGGA